MKIRYRLLPLSFFATLILLITFLSECKKENAQIPVQQNTLETYHIKGNLGGEEITIQGNASYFTDSTNPNLAGITNTITSDGDEDNHAIYGDNDEDEDDKAMLVTGCNWNTTDLAGVPVSTGNVSLRKEVFRIYVTPFLSSRYYGLLSVGAFSFANSSHKNGAIITIRDKAGVVWTSTGDQTGSTFQIITRGENQYPSTAISGSVNCKMYNAQGASKVFTGTFSALVGL